MTPRRNPYKAALEAMKALAERARGKCEERATVAWIEAETLASETEVPVALGFRVDHPTYRTGVS